jgi:hypothetical protein
VASEVAVGSVALRAGGIAVSVIGDRFLPVQVQIFSGLFAPGRILIIALEEEWEYR